MTGTEMEVKLVELLTQISAFLGRIEASLPPTKEEKPAPSEEEVRDKLERIGLV